MATSLDGPVICPYCQQPLINESAIQALRRSKLNEETRIKEVEEKLRAHLAKEAAEKTAKVQEQLEVLKQQQKEKEEKLRAQLTEEADAKSQKLQEQLQASQQQHKEQEQKLRAQLTKETEEKTQKLQEQLQALQQHRKEEEQKLRAQLAKEAEEKTRKLQEQLQASQQQHKEQEATLRAQLAKEAGEKTQKLQEQLQASQQQGKEEEQKLRAQFAKEAEEKTQKLQEQLQAFQQQHKEQEQTLRAQLTKEAEGKNRKLQEQLQAFQAQHKEQEQTLRAQLAKEAEEKTQKLQEKLQALQEQQKQEEKLRSQRAKNDEEKTAKLKEQLEELKRQRKVEQEKLRDQVAKEAQEEAERKFEKQIRASKQALSKVVEEKEGLKRRLEQMSPNERGAFNEEDFVRALKQFFPDDEVERRGRGGDALQYVYYRAGSQRVCAGLIVYECKDTLHWNNNFISQAEGAAKQHRTPYAVVVTRAFPSNQREIFVRDDVVVVHPDRVFALVSVIRRMVVEVHRAELEAQGQVEKTQLLHKYLTSADFRQNFDTVVKVGEQLKGLLDKERREHTRVWEKREGAYNELAVKMTAIDENIRDIIERSVVGKRASVVSVAEINPNEEGVFSQPSRSEFPRLRSKYLTRHTR